MRKISVSPVVRQYLLYLLDFISKSVPVGEIAVELATEGSKTELCICNIRPSPLIIPFVEFHLRPSHKLRLANGSKSVILPHHRHKPIAYFLSELPT